MCLLEVKEWNVEMMKGSILRWVGYIENILRTEMTWQRVCMSKIKYKERTDNSSTGPNDAVCVATLLLYYLLDRDKRIAKWKAPPHPPPAEAGWKRKWYHVLWINYPGICIGKQSRNILQLLLSIEKKITQEWNTQYGELMLSAYQVFS